MKAFIAALCFLVALSCVIAKLSEKECRRPFPVPICEHGFSRIIYSFVDSTDQCESYTGCGTGTNIFNSSEECARGCPYGRHLPSGNRMKGTN
uniref:Putative secreted protein n=1 Tax=Ixodes ricinus TaxID=34613 RepID=V5IBV9_IXORI